MRRPRGWTLGLAAVAAAAAVAGCGGAALRSESLVAGVRHYNEGLRWRRYPESAVYVPPAERSAFFDERDQLDDDLRIDGYELLRVEYNRAATSAVVRVKYTWHRDSRGIVHKTESRQKWALHGKRWLLVAERRVRGTPMPGVPEPPGGGAAAGASEQAGGDGGAAAARAAQTVARPFAAGSSGH